VLVNASVQDGDRDVARTDGIFFTFNQDVDVDSVRNGLQIRPAVPFTVAASGKRLFELKAKLVPDTSYSVQVSHVKKALGFGELNYGFSFRTEAAPQVVGASFNDAALADGQQNVPLRGNLKITFSQPMEPLKTSVLFDGKAVDRSQITWDRAGRIGTIPLTLKPSLSHSLEIPATAENLKHDAMTEAFKVGFSAVVQVPSAGNSARIAQGGAPIIIQIENSTQPTVRPQSGMQQADMVYEYISEYGIPRLTAVYWHPPSAEIGPVRSCRLITVQIEQMYRGMIYCSGANDYVLGQVWKWPNVVYDYAYRLPLMYRTAGRVAPHNVMARPDQITKHTAQSNLPAVSYDIDPAHPDIPLPGGTPAGTINVGPHAAVWRYDPRSQQYLKWQNGGPFMNAGTGQVHAKTVIVERVSSFLDTNPKNTFHGYHTEYYELAGQGTADIYSDGMVIHATWKHPNRDVPAVYYDSNGNPIELNTGLTWIHVIGSDQ
jgi:hypothetical protein